jgi:hypothetical protein
MTIPENVCATCQWWSDDGDTAECINPDSPMYRIYKAADREDWRDVWGCTLWTTIPNDVTPSVVVPVVDLMDALRKALPTPTEKD